MQIALEHIPGETRAVALDDQDRAFSIFIWRDKRLDPRGSLGDVCPAIVRQIDKSQNAVFLELENAEPAYFNMAAGKKPPDEGERQTVEILSESWAEKACRVRPVSAAPKQSDRDTALKAWEAKVSAGQRLISYIEDVSAIDAALEEALSISLALTGGGRLHLEQTKALLSVDIDSAGRSGQGRSINMDAMGDIARQISLRRLGGLLVIDCVGAPKGKKAESLTEALKGQLKAYGISGADILPVSGLGLIEISLPRRLRPIDMYCPETRETEVVISAIRTVVRAARANRADQIEITAGKDLYSGLKSLTFDWQSELAVEFGNRFHLTLEERLGDMSFSVSS